MPRETRIFRAIWNCEDAIEALLQLDPKSLSVRRHGNGFLQVDVFENYRLHIWNPELPEAQIVHTPIHDHRFSFRSLVLYGRQYHWTYDPTICEEDIATHYITAAIPQLDENTILVDTHVYVKVDAPVRYSIPAGYVYYFSKYEFHETPIKEYTITLLEKQDNDATYYPRVLCPVGLKPDNDYDRYQMSEEEGYNQLCLAFKTLNEHRRLE